jgi:DNA-binding NarL/FixJ family response regulator
MTPDEVRLGDQDGATSSPLAGRIRILVVENHQLVADGLANLLSAQTDMVVVGSSETVAGSWAQAVELSPDVALVDFHLPDGTGADAASAIRSVSPGVKIIFLTRDDGVAAQMVALEAGAAGFMHKSRAAREIVDAIRLVAGGGTLFTPNLVASLLETDRANHSQRESITAREQEVLRLTAAGMPSREIAAVLGISYTTVRTHLRSIDRKLDVHSKYEAILKARELGLLD